MDWKSVNDELPKEFGDYLVWFEWQYPAGETNFDYFKAWYDPENIDDDTHGFGWDIYDNGMKYLEGKVTHWVEVERPKKR